MAARRLSRTGGGWPSVGMSVSALDLLMSPLPWLCFQYLRGRRAGIADWQAAVAHIDSLCKAEGGAA